MHGATDLNCPFQMLPSREPPMVLLAVQQVADAAAADFSCLFYDEDK
jgi:hypothetical protein